MEKIKVALCQMNVVDNKEKNIKRAVAMITKAAKKGVDLAILPEMFNCPYENEKFLEYSEIRENSYTLKSISSIAKEKNIHVLAGSIPEKVITSENTPNLPTNSKTIAKDNENKAQENIYNTSFLFDDNGKILGFHRKMHLFDIDIKDKVYFKESDTLKAGNEVTVIDTKFGKIGMAICYDIRFPELSRLMALKGAKLLIFPGAFNLTTGPVHWKLLFKARALDNQVFTIGVSPALDKDFSYNAYGHSIVCNPWGEAIAEAKYNEELIVTEIDLKEIAKIREELPMLNNRRSDIYELRQK
ncbi:MAG: carbon-nitrogen hydrolase family protein [Methanobrevibacter sp.]|nr:carbon-nitrogen hydrolase family protein [Methanobrevibacter sp.]